MSATQTRRAKIVATLGPASSDYETIKGLIRAGVNMVRLNFSHGTAQDHIDRGSLVRKAAQELDVEVAILADLQGPKIRISRFKENKVFLTIGEPFVLDSDLDKDAGNEHQVGIDYKVLPQEVVPGDRLLLDDGRIVFVVDRIDGNKIHCIVEVGGALSNNKGINKLGGGLSAEALTDKDKTDLQTAVSMTVDYIAISFPRSADDMHYARKLIKEAGGSCALVAKIERAEAMPLIDEIILASDAIMVARGDLGVEIGDAALPAAQKHMIERARILNRVVITATQMMESMIDNTIPTRAEVFDVANAVLDGTDAVMLSAETASGKHPIKVVEAMHRICLGAETHTITEIAHERVQSIFNRVDEAIAMSAMFAANHMNIKAILAFTESGYTPLLMSRIRSSIPIYALCPHINSCRKMAIYQGVYPILFDDTAMNDLQVNRIAIEKLMEAGTLKTGDQVLITRGEKMGIIGSTNTLKILTV